MGRVALCCRSPSIYSDFEENASIWGEWHFVAALPFLLFGWWVCFFSCYIMCGDLGKMLIFVVAK